jgi:diguanylate cyclase (GGDEF)-like protein
MAKEVSNVDKLKMFFQVVNLQKENYQLKKRIKALELDIIHDGLTGLKTRRFFYEELTRNLRMIHETDHHKRLENFGFTKLSILFLDIDNFIKINDTYGHAVGDRVLKAVAKIVNRKIWERDISARLGGEEMAIMLLGADEEEAYKKAENLRMKISEVTIKDYDKLKVSASIGVAQASGTSAEKVVKEADTAMYRAKTTGKNKTIKHSDLMRGSHSTKSHNQSVLRRKERKYAV